jgi:hypothetical protein
VSASARGTASDYSKGFSLQRGDLVSSRGLLAALALAGAVLLVAAELSPLYTVVVGALETPRRTVTAGSHHGYALAFVAVAAALMALGALRGARAAALALVALGVVALVVALAVDRPATRSTGTLPEAIAYADARARARAGLTLEITGGALLLVSGGVLFGLLGRDTRARRSQPQSGQQAAT